MLGIGLAERSGFLPVLLRASLARVPARWLTPLVIGCMGNVVSVLERWSPFHRRAAACAEYGQNFWEF
jgi:hypothetical protein